MAKPLHLGRWARAVVSNYAPAYRLALEDIGHGMIQGLGFQSGDVPGCRVR